LRVLGASWKRLWRVFALSSAHLGAYWARLGVIPQSNADWYDNENESNDKNNSSNNYINNNSRNILKQ